MLSVLQRLRLEYRPPLPTLFKDLKKIAFLKEEAPPPPKDAEELKKRFPHTFGQPLLEAEPGKGETPKPLRIGVVFSGGQAAGGHNVIAGLFDALYALHQESKLFGFLDGPSGVIEGKYKEISRELVDAYRNQGGFDLIGSGRTKIETEEQLSASLGVMQKLKLDGLVIVGGDDSNTNAAVLAEYYLDKGCKTKVIGVPKTIDGDLKNAYVEVSFGFDTATKTYAEMIGNIGRDALSAKKYYHFIKLMGRSASHITLECALATHPNLAIISEECAAMKKTLKDLAGEICDLICKRAEVGKNYGVILIPEGLFEFLPDMRTLITELNTLVAQETETPQTIAAKLTPASKSAFDSLPEKVQQQLLLERDPHGNVQLSLIETDVVIAEFIKKELAARKKQGSYKGKLAVSPHFFGYEGRAGFPSNFDAHYCLTLGYAAALLLSNGFTGYMASVSHLNSDVESWGIGGVPLTSLMNIEKRAGKDKPVIQKALVDLKGRAFTHFKNNRERWAMEDAYRFPGPIQFFGERILTDALPLSMSI